MNLPPPSQTTIDFYDPAEFSIKGIGKGTIPIILRIKPFYDFFNYYSPHPNQYQVGTVLQSIDETALSFDLMKDVDDFIDIINSTGLNESQYNEQIIAFLVNFLSIKSISKISKCPYI